MDQNRIDGIVRKRKRDQRNSDRLLKAFVAVFLLGNIFFFSSRLTLPQVYRNIEASETGAFLELGDQIVTFDSWDYSEKDHLFEILIEVENLSLLGDPDMSFDCWCGDVPCPLEVYKVIDDSLYVLHVSKVPGRFTTASLTVATVDDDGEKAYGRFYMTDKDAGMISSAVSDRDYLLYAADTKIKSYKARIRELSRQQQDLMDRINNSVETIDGLETRKKLQTEAEQEETELLIGKVAAEAEELQAELEEVTVEIAELEEKVENQKAAIRELEGGGAS